jgi:tetratricopeptide (TPR) repeat protein
MQPRTADGPPTGHAPDWRAWGLDGGVLTEPTPGSGGVALWLPGAKERGGRPWQRVSLRPDTGFAPGPGLQATGATVVRVRQSGGLFGKLLGRLRAGDRTWVLPDGSTAEQQGERQSDVLLVWSEAGAAPPDEAQIRSRWPGARGVRRVGTNLLLVEGVEGPGPGAPAAPLPDSPRAVAERLLAAARAAGDRRAEASALADLGTAYLHESDAEKSVAALGEALAIYKELRDRSRESDTLGNMGLVVMAIGNPGRALEIFQMSLGLAREAGDRYAEKAALERVGLAGAKLGRGAEALAAFEQALALARAVGHRKHEADLLWYAAIQHAELGHRDQALASGEAAIALMQKMRNPQAALFAEHLRKYRAGETGAALAAPPAAPAGSPEAYLGGSVVADLWAAPGPGQAAAPAEGPGLLRMALSAAKSMARFVGSGFKTAAPDTVRRRLETCASCEHFTGLRCRLCGCFTGAKARLDHEECPVGKWPA